jgi:hypothetical protein
LKTFWIKIDLSNVLVSGQGEILPGSWKLDSPSKRETRKIDHPKRNFLLLPRWPQVRRSLSHALLPLPPMVKVVGRHLGLSGLQPLYWHDPDQFSFYSSMTEVPDPLPVAKAFSSKRTLLQKGSIATKRASMQRGRTLVGLGLYCSTPLFPHRRYLW